MTTMGSNVNLRLVLRSSNFRRIASTSASLKSPESPEFHSAGVSQTVTIEAENVFRNKWLQALESFDDMVLRSASEVKNPSSDVVSSPQPTKAISIEKAVDRIVDIQPSSLSRRHHPHTPQLIHPAAYRNDGDVVPDIMIPSETFISSHSRNHMDYFDSLPRNKALHEIDDLVSRSCSYTTINRMSQAEL